MELWDTIFRMSAYIYLCLDFKIDEVSKAAKWKYWVPGCRP